MLKKDGLARKLVGNFFFGREISLDKVFLLGNTFMIIVYVRSLRLKLRDIIRKVLKFGQSHK